jgi:hypothetical protein
VSDSSGAFDPERPRGDYDRRRNVQLREQLDELLALVRDLSRGAATLTPAELARAQQRLEWLADEIWDSVMRSTVPGEGPTG